MKLKARFDQGDVAVVQGVGYPNPDLSHFTSMGIWMNGWAGGAQPGGATGWIGRFLDGLPNAAAESLYGAVIGTSVPLHMVGAVGPGERPAPRASAARSASTGGTRTTCGCSTR